MTRKAARKSASASRKTITQTSDRATGITLGHHRDARGIYGHQRPASHVRIRA